MLRPCPGPTGRCTPVIGRREEGLPRRRGEREWKEAHLDMRKESPFLAFPGVSALFYTPGPGGHQRSQLSPIWPIMSQKQPIFGVGLSHMG